MIARSCLAAFLLFSFNLANAQHEYVIYQSSESPIVNETIWFAPQIIKTKSKTTFKIDYYLSDSIIRTTFQNDTFFYKIRQTGYFNMRAVVQFNRKGKVYFRDTVQLGFRGIDPYASIALIKEPFNIYRNVPLDVQLNAPGISEDDLVVTGNYSYVTKTGQNTYRILVDQQLSNDKLLFMISMRRGDTLTVLKKYQFPIQEVPNPSIHIRFSGLSSDSALVLIPVPETPFEYLYSSGVKSFTIVYTVNGKTYRHTVNGNIPTKEILDEIRHLPSETWIYFEEISYWIKYSDRSLVWMTSNAAFKLP